MSESENVTVGSDQELFEAALSINDPDDWTYSDIVSELQKRGGRSILAVALDLCESDEEPKQVLGILVLAQLGVQAGETFVEESLPTITRMCGETASVDVLQWGITALGHFADKRGLPTMFHNLDHPDRWVRYHIALALPFAAGEPPDPSAVAALMALMNDDSTPVRDWATFGLGTILDVDNSEIRQALWLRVDDEDPETVFEALRGLGSRHVCGVVARIGQLLQRATVTSYLVEAAAEVPDLRLVGPLKAILANGWDDEGITANWLIEVIEECQKTTWTEIP